MTLFIISKVTADYVVGSWAIADDQHTRFGFYCSAYFLFTIVTSFFVCCRVASLMYFSWRGSEKLHKAMIERVLKAPVNLYFDTTPTGRILNRFSKDLSIFDNEMCYMVGSSLVSAYTLLSIMLISIFIVPWIVLFFIFMVFFLIRAYKRAISAAKEVIRVESVTKSPLLSALSETISGTSTIRAFKKKEEFVEKFHK